MDLNKYKGKKILILGLGREGIDSLRFFLQNCPKNEIAVSDQVEAGNLNPGTKELLAQNPKVRPILGKNYLSSLKDFDIIVKSPGVPIHLPEIERAYRQGKITSQTGIFFEQCPGTVIGITGSKGKSTTSSLIYEILKKAGKKANLVGNIGTPVLSYLANAGQGDVFVCELSAHQLYNLRQSPHIAILLNIYKEHLDYYKSFAEYIRAKANIAIHQSKNDYLIYDSTNKEARKVAQQSKARKIAFDKYDWRFTGKTRLVGRFNLENAKVAAIIGRISGVGDDVINQAITEFEPLANRLEFVGTFNGIDCYNDSLSTIQESAVAAIDGLGGRVQTLIAGGFERRQPFDKLARTILTGSIETLILFPTTGERIWEEIEKAAVSGRQEKRLAGIKRYFVETMDDAVRLALANTKRGRICLLSAASASYNQYRDYAERGEAFKKCLKMNSISKSEYRNNIE